jgi:hypothetical protein
VPGQLVDLVYVAKVLVTGPSLTSSTCIRAPNKPVSTPRRSVRSEAQNGPKGHASALAILRNVTRRG